MTKTNYSTIKHALTEALRQLEVLFEGLSKSETVFNSEVDYWINSIELIRQCLYNCIDEYENDLDIDVAISEIKGEINNAYVLQYTFLTEAQQNRLRLAWTGLEKAEGLLK